MQDSYKLRKQKEPEGISELSKKAGINITLVMNNK